MENLNLQDAGTYLAAFVAFVTGLFGAIKAGLGKLLVAAKDRFRPAHIKYVVIAGAVVFAYWGGHVLGARHERHSRPAPLALVSAPAATSEDVTEANARAVASKTEANKYKLEAEAAKAEVAAMKKDMADAQAKFEKALKVAAAKRPVPKVEKVYVARKLVAEPKKPWSPFQN